MNLPKTMCGVQLLGHGGLDKLVYREDIPRPEPAPGQVLINVQAAGVNNTDINTRIGWYSQAVTAGTTAEGGREGFGDDAQDMGAWEGGVTFPRIQGADCVGRILAVGEGVDPSRVGQKVICQPYIRDPNDPEGHDTAGFLGIEYDGAFAQFMVAPDENALRVPEGITISDEQLVTLPCSGGTAMNMLLMAGAKAGDRALVTGASGGVGTFLIQILKHLGAEVIAVAGKSKWQPLTALGADHLIDRSVEDLEAAVLEVTGGERLSLVADVVGGPQFPQYLALLKRGGRYVTAGAIAGPEVPFDLRTLYLKTLSFFGSSSYRRDCFPALLKVLEEGGLSPLVAGVYPLSDIKQVQERFLEKSHIGSFVLLPPPLEA